LSSENDRPPTNRIYFDHLHKGHSDLAMKLWGDIPSTMGDAVKILQRIRESYGSPPDELEDLKGLMKDNLRKMGGLTPWVSEKIDVMDAGVVESGQQPLCLGGTSLILNKIAYTWAFCDVAEDFVPLFYVADYDGVQPELVNVRLPSPSTRGIIINYPLDPSFEGSSIYAVDTPAGSWLADIIERVEGNYKGLLRGLEGTKRDRLLHNLAHALTVVKSSFYSADNVSEFSTRILSTLINLEAGLDVPIYWFSMEETRRLFQGGYELLLGEASRSRFVEATNEATGLVEAGGYRSQIGYRSDDYVPFFFECMEPRCHRARVELKYRRAEGASNASIYGRCPKCGQVYDFSFDAGSPDLSDIAEWISPRVDSRQIIVNSVVPVLAHIGGPGETSYYAEVIPAAKALGMPFPVFIRYTRTFYNTPWNEGRSRPLVERGLPVMTGEELFGALGRWVEARNLGDGQRLKRAHIMIRSSIMDPYEALVDALQGIKADVDSIKGRLSGVENSVPLLKEMREKQRAAHEIELYLSSAYGRYSPEHFGQEVSWSWLDLAVIAGVGDLLGVFTRQYNENTPNSSMFFVNL